MDHHCRLQVAVAGIGLINFQQDAVTSQGLGLGLGLPRQGVGGKLDIEVDRCLADLVPDLDHVTEVEK